MRVKIEYYNDQQASGEFPCWARSILNDKPICTCGKTWEEVRKEHIERLSRLAHSPEPPIAEEVEL